MPVQGFAGLSSGEGLAQKDTGKESEQSFFHKVPHGVKVVDRLKSIIQSSFHNIIPVFTTMTTFA